MDNYLWLKGRGLTNTISQKLFYAYQSRGVGECVGTLHKGVRTAEVKTRTIHMILAKKSHTKLLRTVLIT